MFKFLPLAVSLVLGLLLSTSLAFDSHNVYDLPFDDDDYSLDSSDCDHYPCDNHRSLTGDSDSDFYGFDQDEEPETESAVTLRLYGNTVMGYYYVTLFFGSPLQRQNLIVDTGSTITTIPCTGNYIDGEYD